jgi:hypothetical protein
MIGGEASRYPRDFTSISMENFNYIMCDHAEKENKILVVGIHQ